MRRWHSQREQALMLRRWRQELANHGRWGELRERNPYCYLAPPGDAAAVDCHCADGIGSMRKHRPYGCEKVRCAVCKLEKHYYRKARATKVRAAIRFEVEARR